MKALESEIEGRVCRWADERNILHVKFTPQGRVGFPDRLFFITGGRPALVELKRPGKAPRRLQAHYLGILLELGYDVGYYDNAEAAIKFLERCARRALATARVPGKGRRVRP